jgi:predicted RNase H-like HicB family nuclease
MVEVNGRRFTVILKHTSEGYSTQVAKLPGCISQGKTEKEATAIIKEAIQGYLEAFPDELERLKQG